MFHRGQMGKGIRPYKGLIPLDHGAMYRSCQGLFVRLFRCGEELLEASLGCARIETSRSGFSFHSDKPFFVDDIDAIWPSRIGALGAAFHIVEEAWKVDVELCDAGFCDAAPLFQAFRLKDVDALPSVFATFPAIGGMSFADIDKIELRLPFIFLVQTI